MGRLIDADALYRKTAEWEKEAMQIVNKASETEADGFNWIRWSTILGERSAFKHDIADAPTVDAVEVVRCKDCKHILRCGVDDWFFCAEGERREDEVR